MKKARERMGSPWVDQGLSLFVPFIRTSSCGMFLLCLYVRTYEHRSNRAVLGSSWPINLQNDSCHSKQSHWRTSVRRFHFSRRGRRLHVKHPDTLPPLL